MVGLRQYAIGIEGGLTWPQEPLTPLAADAVVMDVPEQPDAVERAEHVLLLAARRETMLQEESFHLFAA